MKQVLLVDNYDSFTYNLFQLLEESPQNCEIDIVKNDEIDIESVEQYEYIVISPGPGLPQEANLLQNLLNRYLHSKKILGICLGMQAIACTLGARLFQHQPVFHGLESKILISNTNSPLYNGIDREFKVGRYHSWLVDPKSINEKLVVDGVDEDGHIMSIRLDDKPVFGLQYHPESIMTSVGQKIVENFLNL